MEFRVATFLPSPLPVASLSSSTKFSVFFLRASTRLLTACDRTMYEIIEETMDDEFHAVSGLSRCSERRLFIQVEDFAPNNGRAVIK